MIAILVMPASVLAVTDRDVSNGTDETVSALGCDAYIQIDDPCCNGYCVYVDGAYKLTEGGSGNPDGFCAFYVCAGTHTIEISKNGLSASITKFFQSGSTYSWVTMPYCWCDYHHEPTPDHCQVYIEVQDPCCKGYCVYVDGTYILTEGASGNPDGYCAFYVREGTHKFELRKNGYSTSKSWYCQCGTVYAWVSMPDYWCREAYEHSPPDISAPQVAKPVLTSPLKITPEKDKYYVGDTIRAEFTVKNVGGAPITLDKLLVGGRFNGGKLPNGEYPDFTSQTTTLQPNGQYRYTYRYTGTLTLTQPGNYLFFIAYYIENPTSEEKKLLDGNNWNTCIDLGDGLTDEDRIEDIEVLSLPEGPYIDNEFWIAVSNPAGAYICSDSADFTFSRNLKRGDRGNDVKYLQIVLNANPATPVAIEGPGSPCHETDYFGQLTEAAVIKFQTLHEGLTQTGELDAATRAELNKLHLPVKHVPNGWVLNVTNTAQNEEIHDGCLWWEVEDVTDGIKGWVAYQKISDETKYLVIGDQEELKNRVKKLNTKDERILVIRQEVSEHRTEFLPDNFPLGIILAMIAQEAPSDFDNEFVSFDCGRGIMQTTTNEYVGCGSGIECYSNGAECLQYTHVKDKELSIFDENENPISYCHGSCCYDESSKTLSYCSRCNNIKNGENADDCGKTSYCEEKTDLNWRCTCRHNNNCKCKHYTNTIQGIEANIKDGLYALRDKYNCQCCYDYDRGKDAEWDAEEGLYREEMGDEVIFYSREEECKGGDGQTYDSRIEKIKIGSVQISCNEFKVIDAVWRYNGRSINDYLSCVADRLNEIAPTFKLGYEMPEKDTWIKSLKAVSRSASVMKRIK